MQNAATRAKGALAQLDLVVRVARLRLLLRIAASGRRGHPEEAVVRHLRRPRAELDRVHQRVAEVEAGSGACAVGAVWRRRREARQRRPPMLVPLRPASATL